MIINLIFDSSANNAPASFKAAIQQAAAILEAAITDPITVTIKIGYGVYPDGSNFPITNGSAEGGPNDGAQVPYSQVVGDLVANAAPGDPNFAWLVSSGSAPTTQVVVWPAELKAFGLSSLIPAVDNGIDGFAGFATDIPANALVGVALHELTHAMGRVPSGPQDPLPADIFDLFRFTSPNNQLVSDQIPEVVAYFSVDGGVTHLAAYGQQSDPSDFLNSTVTQNDAFAEFYTPGSTDQFLTPVDLTQLDVLGFDTFVGTVVWSNATDGDFALAANWSPQSVPTFDTIAQITAIGTYVVSSSEDETIDGILMAASASLDITGGTFTIDNGTGSGTTSGTIDVASGAMLILDGTFRNAGTIEVLGGTVDISGTISGSGINEIGSGGTLLVASGGVADPTLILSGGTEIISAGGSDLGAKTSGGEQDVYGVASGATVFAGSQIIEGGGTASGTIVSSGGMVLVNGGARLTGAVISSGGTEIISAGGSDLGTKISGGEQDVYGVASGATVFAGSQVIEAGGIASGTIVSNGGTVVLNAGGTLTGAAVRSGGTVEASGTAIGTTLSSGSTMSVAAAAMVSSTKLLSGGTEVVSAGGTDNGAQISGGEQDVLGLANGAVVFAGSQVVESGGTVSGTAVKKGGVLAVQSDGGLTSATVSSGGLEIISAGGIAGGVVSSGGTLEWVGSNQVTNGPTLRSGAILEFGSGYVGSSNISAPNLVKVLMGGTQNGGAILSGGVLNILAGGIASGVTVSSAGKAVVLSGGTDISAIVSAGGTSIVSSGGDDIGATVSSGGTQIVSSGGTASDTTVASGGVLNVLAGGFADPTTISSGGKVIVAAHGTFEGAVLAGGTAIVSSGGTIILTSGNQAAPTVAAGAVVEVGSGVTLSGFTVNKGVTLEILSGGTDIGGTILSGGTGILESGGQIVDTGSSNTNLNVNSSGTFEFVGVDLTTGAGAGINVKAGAIIELLSGSLVSGGTISGFTAEVFSGSTAASMTVVAAGLLEIFSGGTASGSTISSGGKEIIFSRGTEIDATVSSGGTQIVSSGGTASDTTVASGGDLIVLKGGNALDGTINSGGTEIISSGGTFAVQGIAINSGTLINFGIVLVESGGTAVINGSARNSGLLYASGSDSLLEIVSGAVVSGGVAEVGNGVVEIQGANGENVTFVSNGDGALVLDRVGSAYTGRVSGFGGVGHTNSSQSIDFTSINFAGATLTYTRANTSNTSGTLTVTDGTHSATVTLVGAYSAGSFHASADSQGHLVITDPGVVGGGRVGIGLAQIAFETPTTLAYTGNRNNSGGTLTVMDGKNTANVALLGNYMAASFVTAGNGGTLITDSGHAANQHMVLTHPHP